MRKRMVFDWSLPKHSCFSMLTFKGWRVPVPTHFHKKQAKPSSCLTFAFLQSSFLVRFFYAFYNLSYFTMFAETPDRDLAYFTMFYRYVFGLRTDPQKVTNTTSKRTHKQTNYFKTISEPKHYTLHDTRAQTVRFTLYTSHKPHHTFDFTLYTSYFTLHTLYFT